MRSILSILLPVLLATVLAAAETRVRVTVDHTSLRYQNADNVEVACVVPIGQELVVRGPIEGNWVPVVPPDDVTVWMYSELVHKGQVVRDKAQIRTGPGLNYKVAGNLDRGTPVESRGRLGDWMKIKPLSGFSLWIRSAAIVAVAASNSPPPDIVPLLPPDMATGLLSALTDDTNATANATNAAAATAPTQILPEAATGAVTRPLPPPELTSLPLAASPLQGRRMQFTGNLRASVPGATAAPVNFRLSGPDRSGGIVTFCQVLAPLAQLNAIPGSATVTIEGPAWMLKGDSVPVVKAEKVLFERQNSQQPAANIQQPMPLLP